MDAPRQWKQLERHPLSSEYADITGDDWIKFVADLREFGIVGQRKITLHEGKILDGYQLHRGCVEVNIKPDFQGLPRGMTAEKFVEITNENRRHESQEVRVKRAADRRQRVAEARQRGESLRALAQAENVSVSTIRDDLNILECAGGTVQPTSGVVNSRDGVQRPATTAILCDRCRRTGAVKDCPKCKEARAANGIGGQGRTEVKKAARKHKQGAPIFDDKIITEMLSKLAKAMNERSKVHGGETKEYKDVRERFNDLSAAFKRWQLVKEKK